MADDGLGGRGGYGVGGTAAEAGTVVGCGLVLGLRSRVGGLVRHGGLIVVLADGVLLNEERSSVEYDSVQGSDVESKHRLSNDLGFARSIVR